jgi:hypothetical protein
MNNYHEPVMNRIINGNNYDSMNQLLFIMIIFIGHLFLYYNIYNKYENLTYEDEETLNMEIVKEQPKKQLLQLPYEEKYMEKVRNMKNEYVFTNEELNCSGLSTLL